MKLYKDFRNEQDNMRQMEQDREALALDGSEKVVVIYERRSFWGRKVVSVILMICLLLALAAVIIWLSKTFLMEI